MAVVRGVPEVVEPGVVQRGRRLERGDVPAQLGRLLVRPQHRRHRVPPVQRPDRVLDLEVTGVLRAAGPPGSCSGRRWSPRTAPATAWRRASSCSCASRKRRPVGPVELHHGVQRLPPLLRFARVLILGHVSSSSCGVAGERAARCCIPPEPVQIVDPAFGRAHGAVAAAAASASFRSNRTTRPNITPPPACRTLRRRGDRNGALWQRRPTLPQVSRSGRVREAWTAGSSGSTFRLAAA